MACVSFVGLSPIASTKPRTLNTLFCDHESVANKPDLLRSVTPPPSLSPTKGQIKRFEFNELFAYKSAKKSVDDSAVPFIKEYKKTLKQQKLDYEARIQANEQNIK
eukprot:143123_1